MTLCASSKAFGALSWPLIGLNTPEPAPPVDIRSTSVRVPARRPAVVHDAVPDLVGLHVQVPAMVVRHAQLPRYAHLSLAMLSSWLSRFRVTCFSALRRGVVRSGYSADGASESCFVFGAIAFRLCQGRGQLASGRLLEGWIPGRIDPVRRPGGHMAGETICFVVGRGRVRGISRIEPRPAPTIPPQQVVRVTVVAVLHHHEPALQGARVTDGPRGHRSRRGLVDLFDQHRSIREVAACVVRGDRARRRVDIVKLAGFRPLFRQRWPMCPRTRRPSGNWTGRADVLARRPRPPVSHRHVGFAVRSDHRRPMTGAPNRRRQAPSATQEKRREPSYRKV